jgi:hypothetical protein
MSNVNMGSASGAAGVASATPFTASGMSPDELLEYCSMQLGGLDTEMTNQMNQQTLELNEREAVESAETALEAFGTAGPQTPAQFQTCENAISKAAASLPPGDPVSAQLTSFGSQIATQYGYTAPQPLTPVEIATLKSQVPLMMINGDGSIKLLFSLAPLPQGAQALVDTNNGSLTSAPANSDWQGTTDTLSNMADGIKSGSEIQMLTLQDLVSQEQQAVQLASGMMSTENQTLEDVAKNIGG